MARFDCVSIAFRLEASPFVAKCRRRCGSKAGAALRVIGCGRASSALCRLVVWYLSLSGTFRRRFEAAREEEGPITAPCSEWLEARAAHRTPSSLKRPSKLTSNRFSKR